MTDNPRQDLEREAREAAERWYPPGAGRLGGKLYAGKPAKEGFRERSSFQHGYIAAATAREKEVAELRAEVNDWRDSAAKAMRENCGDEEHCTCVGPLRHQLVRQAQRIVECEEEVVRRGRLNQLAISLADEFERAVASRNPVGGMSVTPSGDFIACAQLPSAVKRMAWWAREIRKEQALLEEG